MDLFSDEIRKREAARRRKDPLWSILSIVLHTALFTVIILCTPVRKLVFDQQGKPEKSAAEDLSSDRIEEIGETLSEIRMNELLEQIEDMQAVLHNMDLMKEELAQDYDAFAEEQVNDIRQELDQLVEETRRNQLESVRAQEVVKNVVQDIVKAEQNDLSRNESRQEIIRKRDQFINHTVERTNTAQANAANSLDKIQVKAEFSGYKKTAEAASKLREAQMEIARKQNHSQDEVYKNADHDVNYSFNKIRKRETEERIKHDTEVDGKAADWLHKSLKELTSTVQKMEQQFNQHGNTKELEKLDKIEAEQKALNAKLDTLKSTLATDQSELDKLAQGDDRAESELVMRDASKMTMSEAYEFAKELESAITESYKDIKATETAISKKMSFESAQKLTDVAKPERAEIDGKLLEESVRNKGDLDKQKAEQMKAIREADAMVDSTVAMMEAAEKIVSGGDEKGDFKGESSGKGIKWMNASDLRGRDGKESRSERLSAMQKESEFSVRLENAAAEDYSRKAKDLAPIMNPGRDGKGGSKKSGSGPPGLAGGTIDIQPGNIMNTTGTAGIPAKWMSVSSWHVIGPFPNPNRVNLLRKFPPESTIDLGATYAGKDGRTLKWVFHQAKNVDGAYGWGASMKNAAEVVPANAEEYSIYYAYAEVFFDQECDRWVAIGSDDRSDVWLNGFKIWGSSNKLKAWSLAEDFRRVHFKRGRNKILMRVENGHWNIGWSFCIATDDSAAPSL